VTPHWHHIRTADINRNGIQDGDGGSAAAYTNPWSATLTPTSEMRPALPHFRGMASSPVPFLGQGTGRTLDGDAGDAGNAGDGGDGSNGGGAGTV
jgi:hypothetical protein